MLFVSDVCFGSVSVLKCCVSEWCIYYVLW